MREPSSQTILGIDPGTKRMGVAVLKNGFLENYAVHTLKNGSHPRDVVDQARSAILDLVRDFSPTIVAIEQPLLYPTKRAALVSVIGEELLARIRERRIRVVELTPRDVRDIVVGDSRATKVEVAHRVVQLGFEELRQFLPMQPKRAALGLRPRDRYWLHAFDALAVALAAEMRLVHRTRSKTHLDASTTSATPPIPQEAKYVP